MPVWYKTGPVRRARAALRALYHPASRSAFATRDAIAATQSCLTGRVRADYDVAEKTFRDPDDFGKEYWGSWARLVLTRKDADRRELLERISEDAVLG